LKVVDSIWNVKAWQWWARYNNDKTLADPSNDAMAKGVGCRKSNAHSKFL